jgi:hypothetical protein
MMFFQDVGVLDDDGQGPFSGTSEAPKLHLSQVWISCLYNIWAIGKSQVDVSLIVRFLD